MGETCVLPFSEKGNLNLAVRVGRFNPSFKSIITYIYSQCKKGAMFLSLGRDYVLQSIFCSQYSLHTVLGFIRIFVYKAFRPHTPYSPGSTLFHLLMLLVPFAFFYGFISTSVPCMYELFFCIWVTPRIYKYVFVSSWAYLNSFCMMTTCCVHFPADGIILWV